MVIRKIRLDTQSNPAGFMQFGSHLPYPNRLLSEFSGFKPEKGELPARTDQMFGSPAGRKKAARMTRTACKRICKCFSLVYSSASYDLTLSRSTNSVQLSILKIPVFGSSIIVSRRRTASQPMERLLTWMVVSAGEETVQ